MKIAPGGIGRGGGKRGGGRFALPPRVLVAVSPPKGRSFVQALSLGYNKLGGVEVATLTLTAVLHKEDDLYVAECPEVGTVSQGYTVEEAVVNLKEATELYLEEFPLPQVSKPFLTTFEAAVSGAAYA